MTEMTMLDLASVDLSELALALEDHSEFGGSWWIDATTGEIWRCSPDLDGEPALDPDARADARRIWPLESALAYRDLEDFIARVPDARARDLLSRAVGGRGAFRRFKDTLFEFPELRAAWFEFHDVRMRRRAIEFLVDEGVVNEAVAGAALADLQEPVLGTGPVDPRGVARSVAADLRQLYGGRLEAVVLYGSHARGDAGPDSDLDLAVVLDDMASAWVELRRMDAVSWRHTLESGITVSIIPVSRAAWDEARRPLIRAAKAEGELVS